MQRLTQRFGYQIRDADNKLIKSVGGYATREQVEPIVQAKRDELARRGWNMTVYITETHLVSEGKQ